MEVRFFPVYDLEAKLVKLDGHAHDHGNTEQAEAMHSYIAQHLHEIEDAIVESVMPRLLDGKELLLQHATSEGGVGHVTP